MKHFYIIAFFLYLTPKSLGQNLYLKIISKSTNEQKSIDSIYSVKKNKDYKSLLHHFNETTHILRKNGYIDLSYTEPQKTNDSVYQSEIQLGKQYQYIHINIKSYNKLLNNKNDTLKIKFTAYEQEINLLLKTLEKKGHALAQIKATQFQKKGNKILTNLYIVKDTNRIISNIYIRNYTNFPKNHLSALRKTFSNKTFNNSTHKILDKEIKEYPFCKELKPAEILFTKDSTAIYYFLEKRKNNTFDGYIGFSNTKSQLKLNGYLDLKLNNILSTGEKFNLFWKNDENKQKTFETNIELPYIFKSKFALRTALNIFKQDSLFQRTKTEIELGHYFNYNNRIYIGYQETESSSFQNEKTFQLNDYRNYFYTLSFTHFKRNEDILLYPYKRQLNIKIGYGYRNDSNEKQKQYQANLNYEHVFELNNTNSINLRNQNFVLLSNYYLTNELFLFGGINSIRGYRENSLQANALSTLQSEYRYKLNSGFILHSVVDFAIYKNNTLTKSEKLYGFGLGLYFLTKNSIMNLIYAIPNNNQQDFNLSTGLFQIKTKFIL